LKPKLFANLANSAEVVPLKTYRGHRCTKDCNQLTNQAFQAGFCWHKQRVRLYQTSSRNISYISIYSDSDVRCTSCTFQSLSLISRFLFLVKYGVFFGILRDLIIASKHRYRLDPEQPFRIWTYVNQCVTIEGVPSKFCGVPQKTCLHPSNRGTHATSAWTKSGSQKPFAAHLFLNIRLKGERRFCASQAGYVLMENPCNIDGTIGVAI